MRHLALAVVGLFVTVLVSGCVGGNNVAIAGQGSQDGTRSKDIECGTDAQIAIGIQGSGEVSVRVTDGGGKTVFSDAFSGQGQQGETSRLTGAAGTWTVTASFSGTGSSFPGMGDPGFQGQWGITLSC